MATLSYLLAIAVFTTLFLQTTAFFAFSPHLDHFPTSYRTRIRSIYTAGYRAGSNTDGTITDSQLAHALFLSGDPLGDCPSYAACQKRLDYHLRKMRQLMKSAAMKAKVKEAFSSSSPPTSNSKR